MREGIQVEFEKIMNCYCTVPLPLQTLALLRRYLDLNLSPYYSHEPLNTQEDGT
jgi:hypothetical protein